MSHLCTNSWQKIWRSHYDFFFAALVSPGSVCCIHRPPTSKLHTIISCKGADALGTVRKQSHSLHVAVCQFDGYKKSIYQVKLFHLICVSGKCFDCSMTILHGVSDKYDVHRATLCCISLHRCCFGLETKVIFKISTHPCYPRNFDSRRRQAVVRHSSGSCQAVDRQSSGSHQAVFRQLSGSHQVIVRQSSGSCQPSSGSHQAVIRQSSGSCQAVIRQSSGSHQAVVNSCSSQVKPSS